MKKNLIYLFFCFAFLSCNNENRTQKVPSKSIIQKSDDFDQINVFSKETKELNKLSSIISEFRYLPLETPEGVLIGNINKVFLIDNLVYIADMFYTETLYAFNDNGEFKFKIQSDKVSPDSFREMSAVTVTSKHIYISDQSKLKLFIYNLNGELTETKNLELYFNNFVSVSDKSFYLLTGTKNDIGPLNDIHIDKNLVHIDKDINLIESYFDYSEFRDVDVKIKSFSRKNDSNYALTPFFDSKIYELTSSGIKIKYDINFADKNFSLDELRRLTSADELSKLFLSNPESVGVIDNLVENKNWLRFSFRTGFEKYGSAIRNKSPNIFHNKKTKKTYKINSIYASNDLNNFTQYQFYNITENDELVSSIPAEEVVEKRKDDAISELSNVKIGDNPVLVFYKLKSKL